MTTHTPGPSAGVLAWHFVSNRLRDGRPIPMDGETLLHEGPLKMCESGLHASERIVDALHYAPGTTACRVECGGEIIRYHDKLVCRERTIVWRIDVGAILRIFARRCALDVINLWRAPDIVRRYLESGEDTLAAAAMAAADRHRDAAAAANAHTAAYAAASATSASLTADAINAAYAAAYAASAWAAVNSAWASADAAAAAARDAAMDAQNARLTALVEAKRLEELQP